VNRPQPDPITASPGRSGAIDIARGLGILLVVYGHVARGLVAAGIAPDGEVYRLVDSVIYSFHMPLFFFLSGSLFPASLTRQGAGRLVRSRIGLILYPYFVWSLLQGAIEVALARHTNGSVRFSDVMALLWQPRAHFWFLYELFAIVAVSALLYRPGDTARGWLVLGLAVVLHFSGFSPFDAFVVNAFGQWFVFFAIGASFSRWVFASWTRPGAALALAAFAFVLVEWVFHQIFGLRTESAGPFVRFPLAIAGIALAIAIGQVLAQGRVFWMEYVGRNAMEIYLAHILAGSGIRIVLQRGIGVSGWEAHAVLGTVGAILLPLALAACARRSRWLNWLFVAPRPWRMSSGKALPEN
jgi:fucose 4-O-acetylase-like acetyltransferase